jgi:chromosome segregation ATPase
MSRILGYINLIGVIALAALCAVQWNRNRDLNLRVIDLEQTRQQQADQIAHEEKIIQENAADLEELRQRLIISESAVTEANQKLAAANAQINQLTAQRDQLLTERDQLKQTIEQWKAAVAARDDALKSAADEVRTLVGQRNDAIRQFKDLAVKYNSVVNDLNATRGKAATRP